MDDVRWASGRVRRGALAARAFLAGRLGEIGQAGEWVSVRAAAAAIRRTGRAFLLSKEPRRGSGSYGGYCSTYGSYGSPRNYSSRYSRWGNRWAGSSTPSPTTRRAGSGSRRS
ncbi:MAG: hypothetical protein U0470_08040 [Anaerolineae bacterium]